MRKIEKIWFNGNIEVPGRNDTDLIWPTKDKYDIIIENNWMTISKGDVSFGLPIFMVKMVKYEDVKHEQEEVRKDKPVRRDTKRPKGKVKKAKV